MTISNIGEWYIEKTKNMNKSKMDEMIKTQRKRHLHEIISTIPLFTIGTILLTTGVLSDDDTRIKLLLTLLGTLLMVWMTIEAYKLWNWNSPFNSNEFTNMWRKKT